MRWRCLSRHADLSPRSNNCNMVFSRVRNDRLRKRKSLKLFLSQLEDKLEHLRSFADTFLYKHHSRHGPRSKESANADDALKAQILGPKNCC